MTFIYVVSVGFVDEDVFGRIEACLEQQFAFATRRMEPLEDPAYAYDPQRNQFASSPILSRLARMLPRDAVRLVALTEKDLFVPILSFIFGQAQLQGPAAIISLARLRQEFYGLPPERSLLQARAVKEAIHEMGHTLGLVHCQDRTCPMSLSTNIRQVDAKGSEFCSSCAILLRSRTDMIRGQIEGSVGAEGER